MRVTADDIAVLTKKGHPACPGPQRLGLSAPRDQAGFNLAALSKEEIHPVLLALANSQNALSAVPSLRSFPVQLDDRLWQRAGERDRLA